jgi:trehalose 2-sulfotransferase
MQEDLAQEPVSQTSRQAGSAFDLNAFSGTPRRYVIVGPPRSGSNLLCDLLTSTQLMGCPIEYLHPDGFIKPMAERFQREGLGAITRQRYVEELFRRRTTPNGVFGLKAFYWQARPYVEHGWFRALFDGATYVNLTRADKKGQIVSLAIALQTQQWTSFDKRQGEAAYDEEVIHQAAKFLMQEETAWEQFFADRDIDPLRVTYESLLADSDGIGRSICARVSVVPKEPLRIERASTKKQRNAVNEEWLSKADAALSQYIARCP